VKPDTTGGAVRATPDPIEQINVTTARVFMVIAVSR
jgi:hypothetical protein